MPLPRLTPLQLTNVVAVGLVVLFNVIVNIPSKPFGSTNAEVSNAYKTAFTPAGYAFSIWGIIYSLEAGFVVLQALPSRSAWTERVTGRPALFSFLLNSLGNAFWLVTFAAEWGSMWVSVAVIFLFILAPLVALYLRLDIGVPAPYRPLSLLLPGKASSSSSSSLSAPSAPSASPRAITWAEFVFAHTFVSVYMGWVCVASIANTSIALTPRGAGASGGPGLAGLSPSAWSVAMQVVAFALGLVVLATRLDAAFVAPIAWALLAIAAQQSSPDWPGDSSVVVTARTLGWTLAVLGGLAAGWRVVLWRQGRTAFARDGPLAEGLEEGGVGKGVEGLAGAGGDSMSARLTEATADAM
jgi:hypothetical protein